MGCFLFWNPATSYSPGCFPSRSLPPGNSHSRAPGRSLRFPTLRLPVSATGGGRLRSHWARTGKNLAKYNVALTRRWPGSSSLPGVSHRALFLRGTRTVAPPGRSLRFPTLRLPVSATGGGRLRSHWARMGKNLAKYNACTRPDIVNARKRSV